MPIRVKVRFAFSGEMNAYEIVMARCWYDTNVEIHSISREMKINRSNRRSSNKFIDMVETLISKSKEKMKLIQDFLISFNLWSLALSSSLSLTLSHRLSNLNQKLESILVSIVSNRVIEKKWNKTKQIFIRHSRRRNRRKKKKKRKKIWIKFLWRRYQSHIFLNYFLKFNFKRWEWIWPSEIIAFEFEKKLWLVLGDEIYSNQWFKVSEERLWSMVARLWDLCMTILCQLRRKEWSTCCSSSLPFRIYLAWVICQSTNIRNMCINVGDRSFTSINPHDPIVLFFLGETRAYAACPFGNKWMHHKRRNFNRNRLEASSSHRHHITSS